MDKRTRDAAAVFSAGAWVNACEFIRNEIFLKQAWTDHFNALGAVFPSGPVNGMIWMAWGFLFAFFIFMISRKFGGIQTAVIGWTMGFAMMWLVIYNLKVLPLGILPIAVPFSVIEVAVGVFICQRISPPGN
jgi:hypothetical protein